MVIIRPLLDRFEMSPKRILSHLLQIDIDRGANAKTLVHRSVPSYGGNDLLADVIDGIGLSLRVLSVANRDLFRSRRCTPFAADEAKIAHSIECIVADLAWIGAIRPGRQPVCALDQTRERGRFRP